MASFKSNPIFYSTIGVLGLAALAACWGIYDRSSAASKNAAQLSQKRSELTALQAVNPVPTEASKAAIEADLARTQVALTKMREELKVRSPVAEAMRSATVPSEPTNVFFNLETFVEKMRQAGQAASVKVKPDERFGFYTYSSTGPDRELIPQVFRQRQIAEYLLTALFEARPSELVSLQRERPKTQAQLSAIASGQPFQPAPIPSSGGGTLANTDLFEIDSRISARVPGFVNATAFRLSFIGETESLRVFLNKLGTFELPLVVRSVEVEPTQKSTAVAPVQANSLSSIFGNVATPTAAEAAQPKPLVEKVISKFTVTVELIDLVEASATEATPTS